MDDFSAQTAQAANAAAMDEVSRIRDIIFGANMRDYERRFAALEQRLLQDLDALRSDMVTRFEQSAAATAAEFDRVHGRIAWEVEQLHSRQQAETDARQASVQDLHDALQRARDEADKRNAELHTLLDHRVRELRDNKTDRHQLGGMLRQLADTLQAASDDRG